MNTTTVLSRKKVIIAIVLFILVVCIIAITSNIKSSENRYGDHLEIANLDQYTKGAPSNKDSLDYIKYDLLRTVNKNVKEPVQNDSIKDILIRDNSFKQEKDEDTKVYTVSFIVDIKSLKQSYNVSYQWSESGKKDNLNEWGTTVKCLPKDQLVYGDFNCKDMFTELSAPPVDPILNHLPHSTVDYKVSYDPTKEKTLNATIYTTAADERIDSEGAIKQYKSDLQKWITSTGLNPKDYKINYTIVRASLF